MSLTTAQLTDLYSHFDAGGVSQTITFSCLLLKPC